MSLKNSLKEFAKNLYYGQLDPVPFDNAYPWLGYAFQEVVKDPVCARKPMYVWGVVQGASLAKILGMSDISVIEFGVAGGAGLISLERIAEIVECRLQLHIHVFGFDTGTGHPEPIDYRDQPNMWFAGQLPMKRDVLERQLKRASLRMGLVRDTLPLFLADHPAPVAFVSFDLDLYSSTRDALVLFETDYAYLLPRVISYFDDIMGHTYNDFAGERLAIHEFNDTHTTRKLSPIYGLRYFVPPRFARQRFWDEFYFAHFFEHPSYNLPDSLNKPVYVDEQGRGLRATIDSDWRAQI